MSKQNPTVMVVEDEVLLLQALTKKLKLSNMDVLSCSSGQQALDYLANVDELPDAISLDYYLKDMNGLAFLQQVKANPKWADIPIFVLSNSASPEKVHNMLALGAKKYVLKAEYRLDEIITMIRELIADSGGPAAPAAATPTPATAPADDEPPQATTPPSSPATPVI